MEKKLWGPISAIDTAYLDHIVKRYVENRFFLGKTACAEKERRIIERSIREKEDTEHAKNL